MSDKWPAMMKRATAAAPCSIAELRRRLRYEPENGRLFWNKCPSMSRRWNSRWAGKEALTTTSSEGYRQGRLNYILVYAHRVAWALYYGVWPSGHIDHINHVRDDNRIENLRTVTRRENQRNLKISSTNKSGVNGVSWEPRRKKWVARINTEGKGYFLGYFDTIEDATSARLTANRKFGFHPNHGGRCG